MRDGGGVKKNKMRRDLAPTQNLVSHTTPAGFGTSSLTFGRRKHMSIPAFKSLKLRDFSSPGILLKKIPPPEPGAQTTEGFARD